MIIYMAIVASGLFMILTTWCIAKKGRFFVSPFSGITLIMVAVLSPFILHEPLAAGSLIGAVVIGIGIYLVIRGKKDENNDNSTGEDEML
ncbi:WAT1-related protein At1g25270-like [Beta vulgaris subsp. vulgaris]|uniref:WAT1-related protein At1g25270-like n=1 Tax=Beta vulgaris subsp. vulgaris TaxID=3555 RepID=UPI0005401D6A|nr:WAT1-related protein At1g25270-like [Beta vulgaris subsp. vulgaris]